MKLRGFLLILCISALITAALMCGGKGLVFLLLPGDDEKEDPLEPRFSEEYRDSGFQDYTDYAKTVYHERDRERVLRLFENDKDYSKVETLKTVRYLEEFFSDFAGWAELMPWYENYDSALGHIDETDYYCIAKAETYSYSIYFFDVQSLTKYYIHNNT